jgi:hypothetical protein
LFRGGWPAGCPHYQCFVEGKTRGKQARNDSSPLCLLVLRPSDPAASPPAQPAAPATVEHLHRAHTPPARLPPRPRGRLGRRRRAGLPSGAGGGGRGERVGAARAGGGARAAHRPGWGPLFEGAGRLTVTHSKALALEPGTGLALGRSGEAGGAELAGCKRLVGAVPRKRHSVSRRWAQQRWVVGLRALEPPSTPPPLWAPAYGSQGATRCASSWPAPAALCPTTRACPRRGRGCT